MLRQRTAVLALALAALCGEARAQRGIDSQIFRPAMDTYGIVTVERAETARQFDFGFKLTVNYAGAPLRLTLADPMTGMTRQQNMLDYSVGLHFQFHLGLTDWLQLGVDMPISAQRYNAAYGTYGAASDPTLARTGFYAADSYTNVPPPDGAPLDARIALKARLFRKGLVGMALQATLTVPFGDDAAFLGDTNFTFRPQAILDVTRGGFTLALNVGAILRETTTVFDPHDVALRLDNPRIALSVGHEVTFGLGASYRFVRWVGAFVEGFGTVPVSLLGGPRDATFDILGGLNLHPTGDVVLHAGAGAGVIPSSLRHDDYRVFFGVAWAPSESKKSGLGGSLDSDGDGIPDAQDLCPNEPEDKDGFEDDDGCPDYDNDKDGIPDALDKCPNEPEDRDGFQDEDGCPDPDNDNDGIPDVQDKCPNEPEDRDGFQDDDGCPDLDNDGDGIPDAQDKCPNEPETRNGIDDDDGCPDSGGSAVPTTPRNKVDIPEIILFDGGKSVLSRSATTLLDKIAERLRQNPQVRRVRVEGHSDDREVPAKRRRDLSTARAAAVREYLMKKGIDADRLQSVGYGEARPVDKRNNADARARNRRAELIVVEQ